MEKKLSRIIGFDKKSNATVVPEFKKDAKEPEAKIEVQKQAEKTPTDENAAIKVVKWINGHESFKWSTMCLKLKIDKGNFSKVLKSDSPTIKPEHLTKIIKFLKDYGYAD